MPLARSFLPIVGAGARALVLGSMPGGASLAAGQYYAHPRNAFWPIMGELVDAGPGLAYGERCERLIRASVAVWDVLQECVRDGSLDASIERDTEVANDLPSLFAKQPSIELILFNGQKAHDAFRRHVAPRLDEPLSSRLRLIRLPSTSPAHAGRSFEQKLESWREAFQAMVTR